MGVLLVASLRGKLCGGQRGKRHPVSVARHCCCSGICNIYAPVFCSSIAAGQGQHERQDRQDQWEPIPEGTKPSIHHWQGPQEPHSSTATPPLKRAAPMRSPDHLLVGWRESATYSMGTLQCRSAHRVHRVPKAHDGQLCRCAGALCSLGATLSRSSLYQPPCSPHWRMSRRE